LNDLTDTLALVAVWASLWALLAIRWRIRPAAATCANAEPRRVRANDDHPSASLAPALVEQDSIEQGEPEPSARSTTHLASLRQAIARRQTLRIAYTNLAGSATERIIRPLRLEGHGECWYLHAYCMLRHAERTFRLDRIGEIEELGCRPRRGDPLGRAARPAGAGTSETRPRRRPRARPPAPRVGFFPAPPDPPPGSPLVRVWLDE
jgi:predicted DNA-binding transcriptional regulator YafY